jgi:hypothetical protein
MTEERLPDTGYRLIELVAFEQFCKLVNPDEVLETAAERASNFVWDWHPSGEREFSVWLTLVLHPSRQVPEQVRVAFIGDFFIEVDEPATPLEEFVMRDAPAILFPYVREAVSSLTSRGISEPYVAPAMNIGEVIATEFSFAASTGVAMLRDAAEVEAFGFPVALPPSRAKSAHAASRRARPKSK